LKIILNLEIFLDYTSDSMGYHILVPYFNCIASACLFFFFYENIHGITNSTFLSEENILLIFIFPSNYSIEKEKNCND